MLSGILGEMSGSCGWTDDGLRHQRDRQMPQIGFVAGGSAVLWIGGGLPGSRGRQLQAYVT